MDDFRYIDAALHCERVSVADIAAEFGTPCYIYSSATLLEHHRRTRDSFAALDPMICFSVKSCGNIHILRLLAEQGSGFDVVSGGELQRVLAAGGDPSKVVFAGVGKTDAEIHAGIDAQIGWFNIESEPELEAVIRIATERQATVRAALRVNPDVDPKTHVYTTTGTRETKFGVDIERARRVFEKYGRDKFVRLAGIHLHIGSPVNSVEPYKAAIEKGLHLIDELRGDGFNIEMLDIGGGFGAHYRETEAPDAATYAEAIVPMLRDRGLAVVLEPGRSIAANSGILLTRVIYLKDSGDKQFVICDAAMNDLMRPALYSAYHFIWPVRPGVEFVPLQRGEQVSFPGTHRCDVVGPVCETGDFLGKDRQLPPMQQGDLLAVFTAGAYGITMASNYNTRPRGAEVLVNGDKSILIRRRETFQDLVRLEIG